MGSMREEGREAEKAGGRTAALDGPAAAAEESRIAGVHGGGGKDGPRFF